MAGESPIAVWAAFFGNLVIAIGKLLAGLASGSAAMFAEAAHSFSDVGNQVLLLIGIKRSKAPPSEKYPFGKGKAAYFWPLIVAVLLFGVAGAYSLFEGIEKFRHPHELESITLALIVLGVAFVIEAVTLGVAVLQAVRLAREEGNTWREFVQENRDASLLTVLIEDGLALVGLPIAAGALLLAKATGDARFDAGGSILIGLLLMGFALFLGGNVRSLLIGRGLGRADLQRLNDIIEADEDVLELRKMQTMHLGPHSALMGAEVILQDHLSNPQRGIVLNRLEKAFKAAVPELQYVYLEDHE